MSTEIIDFKTPSKLFKLEVQGFVLETFSFMFTVNFKPNFKKCCDKLFAFETWGKLCNKLKDELVTSFSNICTSYLLV